MEGGGGVCAEKERRENRDEKEIRDWKSQKKDILAIGDGERHERNLRKSTADRTVEESISEARGHRPQKRVTEAKSKNREKVPYQTEEEDGPAADPVREPAPERTCECKIKRKRRKEEN